MDGDIDQAPCHPAAAVLTAHQPRILTGGVLAFVTGHSRIDAESSRDRSTADPPIPPVPRSLRTLQTKTLGQVGRTGTRG